MKTTGDVLQFSVSLHNSVDLADFNENVVNCFRKYKRLRLRTLKMSTFNLSQTLGLLGEYDSDIGFNMNLGEEDEYSLLDMCRLDENNNDTNPVTIHVYDSTDTMPDIESGVSVTLQVNEIHNSSDPSAAGDQSQDMNNMSSDKAHTPTSRGTERILAKRGEKT